MDQIVQASVPTSLGYGRTKTVNSNIGEAGGRPD